MLISEYADYGQRKCSKQGLMFISEYADYGQRKCSKQGLMFISEYADYDQIMCSRRGAEIRVIIPSITRRKRDAAVYPLLNGESCVSLLWIGITKVVLDQKLVFLASFAWIEVVSLQRTGSVGASDGFLWGNWLRSVERGADDCKLNTGRTCTNGACLSSQCHCNDGYGGKGCEMPDENECKYRPCDVFARCTNTLGSFYCSCFPGYEGDGFSCRDIDECLDPVLASKCVPNSECCNLPAHYVCKCLPGFEGEGDVKCTDIDECLNPDACGTNAQCFNLPGNYTCNCKQGFVGDPYTGGRRSIGRCVLSGSIVDEHMLGSPATDQRYSVEALAGLRGKRFISLKKLARESTAWRRSFDNVLVGSQRRFNELRREECRVITTSEEEIVSVVSAKKSIWDFEIQPSLYGDGIRGIGDDEAISLGTVWSPILRNSQISDILRSTLIFDPFRSVTGQDVTFSRLVEKVDTISPGRTDEGFFRHECPASKPSLPLWIPRPRFPAGRTKLEQVVTSGVAMAILIPCNRRKLETIDCSPKHRTALVEKRLTVMAKNIFHENHQILAPAVFRTFSDDLSPNSPRMAKMKKPVWKEKMKKGCLLSPNRPWMAKDHYTFWSVGCPLVLVLQLTSLHLALNRPALCSSWGSHPAGRCVDLNECDRPGTCPPGSICTNEIGGYSCSCPRGYTGDPYRGCVDINECHDGTNACGRDALCINRPGSYECRCPQGYEGNPQVACQGERGFLRTTQPNSRGPLTMMNF
ncbi:unnamed protein product [Cyprideis torosa]|uniref:Uncharacterized protein n=1 Tax=Cyprideis torosa TaxID=163714 RepID=A0A7R8W4L5_9CRUS|nr:unnamed protein product [Cyprideis torosa]CAG0880777.1 unnamed protein product [Cyprideis torosa]